MVHLKNNFYCRNATYYSALGNSHRSSHIVRRLLTGVSENLSNIILHVRFMYCKLIQVL